MVLSVLLLFRQETSRLTVDFIAESVGVSIPSACRFVSLLRELELVEEKRNATYSLTPRVFALANSAERAFEYGAMLRPILNHLATATGEAALFMRRVGESAVCTEMVQAEHTVRLSFKPGQLMPLERGAGPKILLAGMGRVAADRYLQNVGLDALEIAAALTDLDTISRQKWAVSSAEVDEGVWDAAAPVIIDNRVMGALSVAGPKYRIDFLREQAIINNLIVQTQVAQQVFTELYAEYMQTCSMTSLY